MRFKKLRLVGFKSFVEPTELRIDPGLTGIVGPNGCGKSNLVEALQWAMGEGSARRLRGGEMDDVIFGGTDSRAARNIASVSLALDLAEDETPAWLIAAGKSNGARLFSSDDRELDVERRIDRGKGSNYRVNGREVRARDVQILFADSASGAQSAALVGQGRIGWLIGAKPVERRSLLEEAAGIAGLQSRRHEAELKLSSTEQNLLRVDDQAASLVTQIEKLKKQARQAERYRKLSDEIRHTEALALLARHADTLERMARAQTKLEAAEQAVADIELAVEEVNARRAAGVEALNGAQAQSSQAMREAENLKGRLHALDAEERRVLQQLAENQRRSVELAQDSAREAALGAEASAALDRLKDERDRVAAEQAGDADTIAALRARVAQSAVALRVAEQALSEAQTRAAKAEAERTALSRRRAALDDRHQRLARQRAEALAQSQSSDRFVIAPERLEAAKQTAAAAEAETIAAREALDAAEAAIGQARHAETAALAPLRRVEQQKLQLSAEIKALAKLVASETVNGFPPILDAIKVAKGLEAALGAAFGEDLLASLDPNAPGHWVALNSPDQAPALPTDVEASTGFVDAPPALGRHLARLGIVSDFATGDRRQAELEPGQSLVSREGHLWRWDGLVKSAGVPSAAATRLVHRNRLAELEETLEIVSREFSAAEAVHQSAKRTLEAAAAAERGARDQIKALAPAAAQARAAETALIQQASVAESRRREAVDRLSRIEADLAEASGHLAEAAAEAEALPPIDQDRTQIGHLRRIFEERRDAERAAQRAVDLVERDAAQRKSRLSTLESELATAATRAAMAAAQGEKLAERQERLMEERRAIESRPADVQAERQQLTALCDTARNTAGLMGETLRAAEIEARAGEGAASTAAQALGQARENRVRAEAGQEQAAEALSGVQERIWEAFSCTPITLSQRIAASDSDGEARAMADLDSRLERLKRDREAIGAVNLMAEAELRQLSDEHETIERETDDLRAAIQRLRQAIRELNQEGRERLLAAFKIVNGHFQDLFIRLFGGGHAELVLTGEQEGGESDPLQAGLEIMASPPGKKLQALSLLSGGERALTALALVFAMFLTKPAPICVLDEVDAPLDDANVERFCALVRHISERTATRFLIITHHRVTMARMDRLYGVTMMEKGISRLVSVALREAEMLRESA